MCNLSPPSFGRGGLSLLLRRLVDLSKHSCSFDHLVGAGEKRRWDRQAECLGGPQIDDELKLGRLLDRKVAIVAVMRKIITILNAMIRDNAAWNARFA